MNRIRRCYYCDKKKYDDQILCEECAKILNEKFEKRKNDKELDDYTISRKAALEVFEDIHPLDYNANTYYSKIKNLPPTTKKQALQIYDAFQTVGIMIRAKINRLCNDHKFIEAEEIQKAYDTINEYFEDQLKWEEKENGVNTTNDSSRN